MRKYQRSYSQRNKKAAFRSIGMLLLIMFALSLCACEGVEPIIEESSEDEHVSVIHTQRLLTSKKRSELVHYSSSAAWGDYSQPMFDYEIIVSTDKVLSLEYNCTNFTLPDEYKISASRTLETDEYEEIYSYFGESDLLLSDKEYGDPLSCDGGYQYFHFTLEDGTVFSAGGLNPFQQEFLDAEKFLSDYLTSEMGEITDKKREDFNSYFENHQFTIQYQSDMEELKVSFTEEQLKAVGEENLIAFFFNCENAACDSRISYIDAERTEDGLVSAPTYSIRIRQSDYEYDIIIGDELAATLPMLTLSEVYADYLEQLHLTFTEEQLLSVNTAYFISDLRQLINNNCYARMHASFDAEKMVFTGENYKFEYKDDTWNIMIGDELCARIPYKSIHDFYQSDLEKYNITLTEEELQKIKIDDVIFYIEEFLDDKTDDMFTYDELANSYSDREGEISFEWKEGNTYFVIYNGEKLCEIISE